MTAMFGASIQAVRDYMSLNAPGTDSKYSDATIGSNLGAAGWTLERATRRIFGDVTKTLTFSTDGRPQIAIPGLRTATSVTLQGAALTVDAGYWLLADAQQTGVYTGIKVRAWGANGYLGNPGWFDYNLDNPRYGAGSLPNDLAIAGAWGYPARTEPDPFLLAQKALAAWYTLRPDALLSGMKFTPDGGVFDLSRYPTEVAAFIADWAAGEAAVLI